MSDEIKVNDKRGQKQTSESVDQTIVEQQANQESISSIGFANLIVSLGTSAMIHMGIVENPVTKQKEKDLSGARQEIDLIEMLRDKTKGNLTDAEKKVLEQVLHELHTRFIEVSK
jgi:hypothetical protein